ncbi:kinase-like domain-containing protein [Xylogone sp. PMI_703]|nr:kinase-like domain-containing protein [Xylogone sp. PMI_703]
MAMASPTPMGSTHFASLSKRQPSKQTLRQAPSRPHFSRAEPAPTASHARSFSLNDSSDDEEIPMPMKFSALTKALLNDDPSVMETSLASEKRNSPEPIERYQSSSRAGSANVSGMADPDQGSPKTRNNSPVPRRVVRLSGSRLSGSPLSSSLVKMGSSSRSAQRRAEARGSASPQDINTPAPAPRTVRIPVSSSSGHALSGSSGRPSSKTNSASRHDDEAPASEEYPSTVGRPQLATSQGSVSRYGTSALGRPRYGEEAGLQSSMRVKRVGKVAGSFLSGPARRGRRRMEDDEQSPADEQGDGLDAAGASQEPQSQSQESHLGEPQGQEEYPSSQESQPNRPYSSFSSDYRDLAASGSPVSSKELINSMRRSRSPPPPTLESHSDGHYANGGPSGEGYRSDSHKPAQPVFKLPAPRPDLPSRHDQENEAPPTFKRNKPASLMNLENAVEKPPVRPASVDIGALQGRTSPERQALASRSQNTPRRPAPPPPKMSVLEAATSTAGAAAASHATSKRNKLKVNGKYFTRMDCIGRGGSSKVFRVMAENSKIFALKRVSLEDADEMAVMGFKGEIDLLKKLESVERVIRLYDYELNEEKGTLSVLMEMGELDMNKILELRLKSENAKFDPSFVRHYWKEMLECLQAVHAHDIVHSDLKPHNFVLVQGRLKLIDFGIANAIKTDETVNVHRETQVGTPNYMSPESLIDSNARPDARGRISNEPRLMKLGKPSDIWSLGCILYQMVYGRAPFAHIPNQMQRCQAIINFNYAIEYPAVGVGGVPVPASLIRTLKKCLNRDQHQRPSATELLDPRDPFLYPVEYGEDCFPMTEELLGRILQSVAAKCKDRTPSDIELLSLWPAGYFNSLRKNMREGR